MGLLNSLNQRTAFVYLVWRSLLGQASCMIKCREMILVRLGAIEIQYKASSPNKHAHHTTHIHNTHSEISALSSQMASVLLHKLLLLLLKMRGFKLCLNDKTVTAALGTEHNRTEPDHRSHSAISNTLFIQKTHYFQSAYHAP